MRVAFVASPWENVGPVRGRGTGVTIVTNEFAHRLAQRAATTVYSARRGGGPDVERDAAGVEYRRVRITPENYVHRLIMELEPNADRSWFRLPYWASSRYYRGYATRIGRDLAKRSVDIVQVNTFSQFVPVIRELNPQCKTVLHVHEDWLALLDRASLDRRLQHVDLILAPSEHTADRIRSRFPAHAGRVRVLYNGVDAEHFVPRPAGPTAAVPDQVRCLFVGRISPEKGFHVLLDAFARLAAAFPGARLDVYGRNSAVPYNFFAGIAADPVLRSIRKYYTRTRVGRLRASLDGGGREYFETMEQTYGELFDRSVFFHGEVPQAQLREIYQGADVLVFPSVCDEAFGMVLVEAMACGLPVVAARAGGIVDVAARAGALEVVERNDAVALVQAIGELAADPALRARLGQKGREFAASGVFGWDRLADELWAHYADLMRVAP